jgi:hypothetical protein
VHSSRSRFSFLSASALLPFSSVFPFVPLSCLRPLGHLALSFIGIEGGLGRFRGVSAMSNFAYCNTRCTRGCH